MKRAVVLAAALACLPLTVDTYVLKGPKWTTNPVGYYINPANADMPESQARAIVVQAATDWPAQSRESLVFKNMGDSPNSAWGYNKQNLVAFSPDTHDNIAASTYSWSTGGTKLLEFDIIVWDGKWKFMADGVPCASPQLYLHDTLIHEFGHAFGLGHSTVRLATMYPSVSYCSTILRTLDPDDIAGVLKLYPPAAAAQTRGSDEAAPQAGPAGEPVVDQVKAEPLEGTITKKTSRDRGRGRIYSELTIDTGKGTRTVTIIGGTVGNLTLSVSDYPDTKVGQKVKLTVNPDRTVRTLELVGQ